MLEAKYAAFFDSLGWSFQYEPFETYGYIPDFLIDGTNPLLVEIKPAVNYGELSRAIRKAETGLAGIWEHGVLLLPANPMSFVIDEEKSMGLLGEFDPGDQQPKGRLYWNQWSWGTGYWETCLACGAYGIYSGMNGNSRPGCGHPAEAGSSVLDKDGEEYISKAWAKAGNEVQWVKKDTDE
jgi:hypothetical protein